MRRKEEREKDSPRRQLRRLSFFAMTIFFRSAFPGKAFRAGEPLSC